MKLNGCLICFPLINKILFSYCYPHFSNSSLPLPSDWPPRYNPCPTRRRSSWRRLQFPLSGRVPGVGKEWNPTGDWNIWRYKVMLCGDVSRTFNLIIDVPAENPVFSFLCPSWNHQKSNLSWNFIVKGEMCLIDATVRGSAAGTSLVFGPSMNPYVASMLLKCDFTLLTLLNSSSMTFYQNDLL